MQIRALLAAALVTLAALPVSATPHFHDGNDLWVTPFESGWGININHQGDTMFASLFVYGLDGKARWYTASSLVGGDAGDRPAVYTGALYESSGPGIGGSFDPARVTRRQVGSMSIELGTESHPQNPMRNYAHITYDVDGVRATKHAYPFSFVALGLTGLYTGYLTNPSGSRDDVNMNVTLNGASFAMSMTTSLSGSCTFSGTQDTNGSLFNVLGSFSCNGNNASGSFVLRNVDVTRHGFTAKVSMNGMPYTDLAAQRTSSAIRGDGYATDLWLAPNESGWGLNLIEQGDTLFGTLFVYDSAGQPRWYSASNLAWENCAPIGSGSGCTGRYRGALVESTGPWFGTAFDESAVRRRQVGTMTVEIYGNDTAHVVYTVDGVTVTRLNLSRFAFRANSLAGLYAGHMRARDGANDRGMMLGDMSINVAESGDSIVVTMAGSRTCTMRGRRVQYGRQVNAFGPYDCGGAPFGQLFLSDIYVTSSGFTGTVDFGTDPGVNSFYTVGRIEAARTFR